MKNFKINLYKGHPIINDGENIILIDTGAPKTIHATNQLSFYSKNYDCSTNYMGLTVSKISDMLDKTRETKEPHNSDTYIHYRY